MAQKSKNTHHSRRGFLRSLFGDVMPEDPAEMEEKRLLKQRASVLALKYAKNEARLAKIGVKAPISIDDTQFRVQLTGCDAEGDTQNLDLIIDPQSSSVTPYVSESDAEEGDPES